MDNDNNLGDISPSSLAWVTEGPWPMFSFDIKRGLVLSPFSKSMLITQEPLHHMALVLLGNIPVDDIRILLHIAVEESDINWENDLEEVLAKAVIDFTAMKLGPLSFIFGSWKAAALLTPYMEEPPCSSEDLACLIEDFPPLVIKLKGQLGSSRKFWEKKLPRAFADCLGKRLWEKEIQGLPADSFEEMTSFETAREARAIGKANGWCFGTELKALSEYWCDATWFGLVKDEGKTYCLYLDVDQYVFEIQGPGNEDPPEGVVKKAKALLMALLP